MIVVAADECPTGKWRAATLEEAEKRLREIQANPKTRKIPTRAYLCVGHCYGWHLTSKKET